MHTNGVYSNVDVEPYVKGHVDALRAEGKNVVLVSAGDAFKGTALSLSRSQATAAIGALQSAMLVNCVGDGRFAPNLNATRASMALLADRLLKSMAAQDKAA